MSQCEGSVSLVEGMGVMAGLGFREKRCLALSVTAVWMSEKVTLRNWRRRHWSCRHVSQQSLKETIC